MHQASDETAKKYSHRDFARKMHELRIVNAVYGGLDGGKLSLDTCRYVFDALSLTQDDMYGWMNTPSGAAAVAAESMVLISFSLIANIFTEKDKNAFKRYVAIIWPYFRDVTKALKYAYKGIRGLMPVLNFFSGLNLNYLILPIGLILGLVCCLTKILTRKITAKRKEMTKQSEALFEKIKKIKIEFSETEFIHSKLLQQSFQFSYEQALLEAEAKAQEIGNQSMKIRALAFGSTIVSGIVDGLYLQTGALAVTAFIPPVFVVMAVCCLAYTAICIITRVFEEYQFQEKLNLANENKVALGLLGKKIEGLYAQYCAILKYPTYAETRFASVLVIEKQNLLAELSDSIKTYKDKRMYIRSRKLSTTGAILSGLRDGLAVYGAITSAMFALIAILSLCSVACPPAIVIAVVLTGLICLIGYASYYAYCNKTLIEQGENDVVLAGDEPLHIDKLIEGHVQQKDLESALWKKADLSIDSNVPDWAEVARSFFSGVGKGQKTVGFFSFLFQIVANLFRGSAGGVAYQDAPAKISLIAALLFAVGFGLRAHVKAFGRDQDKLRAGPAQLSPDADPRSELESTPRAPAVPSATPQRSSADKSRSMPAIAEVQPHLLFAPPKASKSTNNLRPTLTFTEEDDASTKSITPPSISPMYALRAMRLSTGGGGFPPMHNDAQSLAI